ncbi:hypothetical protein [Nocardioides lijunqiniae]|uniref:hypothetical protein n=1 Tax=Nocardioides lijunqiniae TaxID=2760832 RepID=UPI0018782221|nr:hypothetical protein [Nocardioides lijunqiniae]
MPLRSARPRPALALAVVAIAATLSALAPPAATADPATPVAPVFAVSEWSRSDSSRLPDLAYSQIELSSNATYGIASDGRLHWAADYYTGSTHATPSFAEKIVDVAVGQSFGLALDDTGHVHVWGSGLALDEEDAAATYRDVTAYRSQAIGVTTDGELRLWGTDSNLNELGFDPDELAGREFVAADTSYGGSVALTDDGKTVSAGVFLTASYSNPFPADRADETIVEVDLGDQNAIALTDEGEVIAWGAGYEGQLDVPASLAEETVVAVSTGFWWSAAVTADGEVVTWGEKELTELPPLRSDARVVGVELDRYRSALTYARIGALEAPTLSDDDPVVGTPVTVEGAVWSVEPDSVSYAWEADGQPRPETSGTFTPTAGDLDALLSVTITAHKEGYLDGVVRVDADGYVAPGKFETAPAVTVRGVPRVGEWLVGTLEADTSPLPDSYDYQWLRQSEGEGGPRLDAIEGAEGLVYEPTPADVGHLLTLRVTAERNGFVPASATGSADGPVTLGTMTGGGVTVTGTPRVGRSLAVTTRATEPAAESTSYAWRRNGVAIPGATRSTYVPLARDLGALLTVAVTTTTAGYEPASATSTGVKVGLPAAKLAISAPAKAVRGKRVTVTLSRLAPGEAWTLRLGGKVVARGKATARGTSVVRLKVPKAVGRKALALTGSYADRSATRPLKVVAR